jgi:hypothetical protein
VVALVAAGVLATAAAADARTIPLNWVEQRSADYFPYPMTFKVKDVVLTAKAWSVHASFTNRSKVSLKIAPPFGDYYAPHTFGLGWASCVQGSLGPECGLKTLDYTYAKPKFPRQLQPRQTWSGVFGGLGRPPKGKLIYVTFGTFFPPGSPANGVREFSWDSSHAFKL